MDADDKIGITKDGQSRKAICYDHIHTLFSLYQLASNEQDIMRNMAFVPTTGISSRVLLLDFRAAYEKKPEKAIKLEKKAVELISEVTAENALLAANLHANLGGLYKQIGKLELAKQHMEMGIHLLE